MHGKYQQLSFLLIFIGRCLAQDAATTSPSPSGTQTPTFTMPTANPLVRGQDFEVSWKNAGPTVEIFLIGKVLNSNARATSETEIGSGALNSELECEGRMANKEWNRCYESIASEIYSQQFVGVGSILLPVARYFG